MQHPASLSQFKNSRMKKFFCFLLFAIALSSCSLEDSGTSKEYYLPVDHVVMASDVVNLGETLSFTVTYRRPNDCYIFNGYSVEKENLSRTVKVRAVLLNEGDCVQYEQGNLYDVPLNFTPEGSGTFVFRFWAGNDENDEPVYIEKEIEVENNI